MVVFPSIQRMGLILCENPTAQAFRLHTLRKSGEGWDTPEAVGADEKQATEDNAPYLDIVPVQPQIRITAC